MSRTGFVLTITSPLGVVLDLSERVSLGDIGDISEELEEDLLELTHGDVSITVRDDDGVVTEFLENAKTGDVYEIVLERETLVRKPKWRRIFGGVLDIPLSLSFNHKDKTVGLQVFSFTKLLELTSAETVSRSVTMRTGSVTVSTKVVTVSSSTDLLPGDDITLADVTNSETQRISTVDSGTQVTTVDNWTNGFSSADLILETPFLRNKSIKFLAEQVFTTAGITNQAIALDAEQSDEPFATVFNSEGLGAGVGIINLLSQGGKIETVLSSGTDNADNPQDGFTNESGVTIPKGDWQPYEATEPGSLVDASVVGDNGARAFDHVSGDYWATSVEVGAMPPDEELHITKNGALDTLIDTHNDPAVYGNISIDFDPNITGAGGAWVSFVEFNGVGGTFYRIRKGAHGTDSTWGGGGVRNLASLGLISVQHSASGLPSAAGDIRFYVASTGGIHKTLTGQPIFNMWTMRVADGRISALYRFGGATRIRQWDSMTFEQLADYQVSSQSDTKTFMTVWNNDDGIDVLIGGLVRELFVISREFAGVISYADFDGASCGEALKSIAVASASYIAVDPYKVGLLRSRASKTNRRNSPAIDIGTPLDDESVPLGDFYRASVLVTGVDVNGVDISEVSPPGSGDSANRLELDSPFVDTVSLAQSIGLQYVGFLSMIKSTRDVTIREPVVLSPTVVEDVHALDLVAIGGIEYRVIGAETDIRGHEQELTLIEVPP